MSFKSIKNTIGLITKPTICVCLVDDERACRQSMLELIVINMWVLHPWPLLKLSSLNYTTKNNWAESLKLLPLQQVLIDFSDLSRWSKWARVHEPRSLNKIIFACTCPLVYTNLAGLICGNSHAWWQFFFYKRHPKSCTFRGNVMQNQKHLYSSHFILSNGKDLPV